MVPGALAGLLPHDVGESGVGVQFAAGNFLIYNVLLGDTSVLVDGQGHVVGVLLVAYQVDRHRGSLIESELRLPGQGDALFQD